MQGLTDGPVKTYLFRMEFNTLEEAIRVAEQEDFSVKQAHTNSNSYRPSRRQENGGPEPMNLCNARNESSRVNNYKKLQNAIYVRRQGIMHVKAVPRARYHVPQKTITAKRPSGAQGVGPTLMRRRINETDSQKNGQGQ